MGMGRTHQRHLGARRCACVDAEGFPNPNPPAAGTGVRAYPLHTSDPSLNDGPVTQACPGRPGFACGDYNECNDYCLNDADCQSGWHCCDFLNEDCNSTECVR